MTTGQAVTITGAAGTCPGLVVAAVSYPAELPEIEGAPDPRMVAAILAERDIVELVLIEHIHSGRLVAFFALRNAAGLWCDLHGQRLTIEAAS